jgi:hypothetical protein
MGVENNFKFYWKTTLILIIASMLIAGCECTKVDCADGLFVEINFIQNGQAVSLDDTSFIPAEELIISSDIESNVSFFITDGQLNVLIKDDQIYTMEIGEIDTVSIAADFRVIDSDDCCDVLEIAGLSLNGQEICNVNCMTLSVEIE